MITLLVPTRRRPHRLADMIGSVVINSRVMPQILCYVADDDHSYDYTQFPDVKFIVGPKLVLSDTWNALIPHAKGDIFMQAADDIIFHTPGWDAVVEQAFAECPDKILLCHGDDLGPSGKVFATHPFIHRKWFETVGYFTGPGFSNNFSDAWPNDVADMIGRKKLLPIVTEHNHHLWGKAAMDETYRENLERDARDNNGKLYEDRLPDRIADAEKLRKALNTPWENERKSP